MVQTNSNKDFITGRHEGDETEEGRRGRESGRRHACRRRSTTRAAPAVRLVQQPCVRRGRAAPGDVIRVVVDAAVHVGTEMPAAGRNRETKQTETKIGEFSVRDESRIGDRC